MSRSAAELDRLDRTEVEKCFGLVRQLKMDAPVIAKRLLAQHTPKLLDYLFANPGWHHEAMLCVDTGHVQWAVWKRLLWALEVTGDITVKEVRRGWLFVRVSTSRWLREVQRRAAARPCNPVPV